MQYLGKGSRILASRRVLLFFMTGFVAGVFFANVFGRQFREYAGLLSEYYLNRYKYMEIVREQLFFYLAGERLWPAAALCVLSLTAFRRAAACLFFGWQGFAFGTLLTISILKFGVQGIVLCVAGMFPQYLFYVPAAFLLAEHMYREGAGGSYRERSKGGAGRGTPAGNAAVCILVFVLLAAGIVLETWVNPDIVQRLLKFL